MNATIKQMNYLNSLRAQFGVGPEARILTSYQASKEIYDMKANIDFRDRAAVRRKALAKARAERMDSVA